MLGHKLGQVLSHAFDTHLAVRRDDASGLAAILDTERVLTGVSAEDMGSVANAVAEVGPDVVVNCVGIVKQASAASEAVPCITVNALFPHRLADLCTERGARLVHISTDCVFSGRAGGYTEDDIPDPVDLYGRSKLLGEVDDGCLTIRTSIIGRELSGAGGLLEWFLAQHGSVRGFRRAIFSGLTTQALAELLATLICEHRELTGIRHVASAPISKHDLLGMLREAYGLDVQIVADDEMICDRSLDGTKLERETGVRAPSWAQMIAALAADETPYEQLRSATGSC
jgi:dTDP-4-dehydrorhamnose reductase